MVDASKVGLHKTALKNHIEQCMYTVMQCLVLRKFYDIVLLSGPYTFCNLGEFGSAIKPSWSWII